MRNNNQFGHLQDMFVFAKVVEELSFSKAAEKLNSSPSAVSRAVSRLEEKLAIRLLNRTTRKLSLTDQGQVIYQHCCEMTQSLNAIFESTQHVQQDASGQLNIYAPRALGKYLIHPLVIEFLKQHPKMNIVFTLEDRVIDPLHEKIDFEFKITQQPPLGFMGRKLFSIQQKLYASSQYLSEHPAIYHPNDLKQHSCLALSDALMDARWRFEKDNKKIAIDVQGRYFVNHASARLEAIIAGLGIGSLPEFMAQDALNQGLIQPVLTDWNFETNFNGDVWLLYPPTKNLAYKAKIFRDFIIESCVI